MHSLGIYILGCYNLGIGRLGLPILGLVMHAPETYNLGFYILRVYHFNLGTTFWVSRISGYRDLVMHSPVPKKESRGPFNVNVV